MDTKTTLSHSLQAIINAKGFNGNRLSAISGVPQPVIHRLQSGETTNPKVQTLQALCKALDVTLPQLLGETPWEDRSQSPQLLPCLKHDALNQWPNAASHASTWASTVEAWPDNTFGVTLWDNTMAPVAPQGALAIIAPGQAPQHEDWVLVQHAQHWRLRIYLSDGCQSLLKALDADFPTTPITAADSIVGVTLELRVQPYKTGRRSLAKDR